jgi:hypothetical protein
VAAYYGPLSAQTVVSRHSTSKMAVGRPASQADSPISSAGWIDQDGISTPGGYNTAKPKVRLLARVQELRVLSNLADAGLLSAAEEQGAFSKLEAAGAFSTIEKLLPLADDLKLLSFAENLLNTESSTLALGGVALLVAEAGLIAVVPDDIPAFVALQAVTGVVAGAAAVTLFGASQLFSVLQGED